MVEVITNVTINLSGINPYGLITYCKEDLDVLKQRPGIVSGKEFPVDYAPNGTGPTDQTAGIVGVDSTGHIIAQPSDLIVLPCPPYCDGDNCTELTSQDAIAYLSSP